MVEDNVEMQSRIAEAAAAIKQLDPKDDGEFASMMCEIQSIIPDAVIADGYGVSLQTVVRWRNKQNLPQPFARPVVKRTLLEALETIEVLEESSAT